MSTEEIKSKVVESSPPAEEHKEDSSVKAAIPEDSTPILDDGKNDFINTLPEEYRSEPSLKHIKDIGSLTKSYLHAQKEIGGRIRIPNKDASDDVRKEFYSKLSDVPGVVSLPDDKDPDFEKKMGSIYDKLGRPKAPEDYQLTLPEELPQDEEFQLKAKELAYKVGLNQTQLNALAQLEVERAAAQQKVCDQQKINVKEYFKSQWGDKYEENVNIAKLGLKKFEEKYPQAVWELRNGLAGSNPVLIEAMYEIAVSTKEGETMAINDSTPNKQLTTDQIAAKIREIRLDAAHPFNVSNHPDHAKAVEEVSALYQSADQKA